MKKVLLSIYLGVTVVSAQTRTVSQVYNVPVNTYYSDNNFYSKDLSRIEAYLYGRTYKNEIPTIRLNRIEKTLFNKTYSTLALAQRMNNVIEAYQDDYYNRNYLSQYYTKSTPTARLHNRFVGTPTGFSPQIFCPNYSGINGVYGTNRGYGYNNFVPANTGIGVRILD
jgi:hypothetical protein